MNDHPVITARLLASLVKEHFCYLTTTGRVSGNPHEIEIWFWINDHTLYLLAEGRDKSDWVKNLLKDSAVTVRVAKKKFKGTARVVTNEEEDMMARKMLAAKYQQWREGHRFSHWARTALVVGIDLDSLTNQKG